MICTCQRLELRLDLTVMHGTDWERQSRNCAKVIIVPCATSSSPGVRIVREQPCNMHLIPLAALFLVEQLQNMAESVCLYHLAMHGSVNTGSSCA